MHHQTMDKVISLDDNSDDKPLSQQSVQLTCYDGYSSGLEMNRTAFPFCYELSPGTYLLYWNHDLMKG